MKRSFASKYKDVRKLVEYLMERLDVVTVVIQKRN